MAFVKFSRGLLSAYTSLSRKDPDTLYLVYENENSAVGSLYLGTKLISSVSSGGSATALSDLSDVSISGTLEDGMLLQYNGSTGNGVWEAVALNDVISSGSSHAGDNISIEESLESISNPSEKDIAVIGSDVYIYDGSDWVQLTDTSLVSRIADLESSVGHAANAEQGIAATGLYADIAALQTSLGNVYTKTETNTYVAEQIAAAQHLQYQIVTATSAISVTATEAIHTVYLVPKATSATNDGYDEYFVVNGELEKIGDWDVDLSNYVRTDDNRLLTSEQQTKINAVTLDSNNNLVITSAQVSDLNSAIANNQLIKSVEPSTFNVTNQGQLQLTGVPSNLLSNYVTTTFFNATVGDLAEITDRLSTTSTLVQEINAIKDSLIWRTISSANNE